MENVYLVKDVKEMYMLGKISSLKVELKTKEVWHLLLAALPLLAYATSKHAAVFQK